MKEFNKNFVIEFRHEGKTLRERIDLDAVKRYPEVNYWTYEFWKEKTRFRVMGSLDADGDVRTSGTIDREGHAAAFWMQTSTPMQENVTIENVDIVETDVPAKLSGTMYVSVRIDFEYDDGQDEGQVRQDIMSDSDYGFKAPEGVPFAITDTTICGEID